MTGIYRNQDWDNLLVSLTLYEGRISSADVRKLKGIPIEYIINSDLSMMLDEYVIRLYRTLLDDPSSFKMDESQRKELQKRVLEMSLR